LECCRFRTTCCIASSEFVLSAANKVETDLRPPYAELDDIGILKSDFRHPLPVVIRTIAATDISEQIGFSVIQDLGVAG
jgi:hypothetical protein